MKLLKFNDYSNSFMINYFKIHPRSKYEDLMKLHEMRNLSSSQKFQRHFLSSHMITSHVIILAS